MKNLDSILEALGRTVRFFSQRKRHPTFPTPNFFEAIFLRRENAHRKKATALKKEKRYLEAIEELRKARDAQYRTAFFYDCKTLLRVPKYLVLAKKYPKAIAEANLILKRKWPMSGDVDEFRNMNQHEILSVISDAFKKSGNILMASRYSALAEEELNSIASARVAAIRREFEESYKETGSDLGRVSGGCGEVNAKCCKWHRKIISVLGKTKGYPTLEDIDKEALFGKDTCHRIDYIDPTVGSII